MEVAFQIIINLLVVAIIVVTLLLNTKSEGLGAAITGASDTYRGAVGIEEQRRKSLQYMGYGFMALCFLYAVLQSWVF